jgi:hypothetical protein
MPENTRETCDNKRNAQALVMPARPSPVPVVRGDHDMADTSLANPPVSPTCPRCGYVMCQRFDDKPITALATLAVPNGSYICYYCGRTSDPSPKGGLA